MGWGAEESDGARAPGGVWRRPKPSWKLALTSVRQPSRPSMRPSCTACGAGAHYRTATRRPPTNPTGARSARRRPVQLYRPRVAHHEKLDACGLRAGLQRAGCRRSGESAHRGWALSNHPNDSQEAEPTLAAIPSAIGTPEAAALDAGYFGPATLQACASAASSRISPRAVIPITPVGSSASHLCKARRLRMPVRRSRWPTSSGLRWAKQSTGHGKCTGRTSGSRSSKRYSASASSPCVGQRRRLVSGA